MGLNQDIRKTTKEIYSSSRRCSRIESPVLSFWVNCGVIAVLAMLGMVRVRVSNRIVDMRIINVIEHFWFGVLLDWRLYFASQKSSTDNKGNLLLG